MGRTRPTGYSLDNLPSDDENGMNRLEEYLTTHKRYLDDEPIS